MNEERPSIKIKFASKSHFHRFLCKSKFGSGIFKELDELTIICTKGMADAALQLGAKQVN